jgi:hypothetical protein
MQIISQTFCLRLLQDLIGWNDPSHSYDYWNLTFDVPYEGMPRKNTIDDNTRNTAEIAMQPEYLRNADIVPNPSGGFEVSPPHLKRPVFSLVKHYPPKWLVDEIQKQWDQRVRQK